MGRFVIILHPRIGTPGRRASIVPSLSSVVRMGEARCGRSKLTMRSFLLPPRADFSPQSLPALRPRPLSSPFTLLPDLPPTPSSPRPSTRYQARSCCRRQPSPTESSSYNQSSDLASSLIVSHLPPSQLLLLMPGVRRDPSNMATVNIRRDVDDKFYVSRLTG